MGGCPARRRFVARPSSVSWAMHCWARGSKVGEGSDKTSTMACARPGGHEGRSVLAAKDDRRDGETNSSRHVLVRHDRLVFRRQEPLEHRCADCEKPYEHKREHIDLGEGAIPSRAARADNSLTFSSDLVAALTLNAVPTASATPASARTSWSRLPSRPPNRSCNASMSGSGFCRPNVCAT
jgi:hypothetical protein